MGEKLLDDELDALVDVSWNEVEQRRVAMYDGVLGVLPEWVPDWRKQEFQETRNRLLEKFTHSKILQWLDSHNANCITAKDCDYIRLEFIPLELKNDISCLALIMNAVSLGRKVGLAQMAGNLAAKGDSFSEGGSSKKGKIYEPKASIKSICDALVSTDFNKVIKVLENEDDEGEEIDDLLYSIGVTFCGLDYDKKLIWYYKKGENPDEQKTFTFGRLRNILTELKKN